MKSSHLTGVVRRTADETGVPGLDVEVIDSDHQFDDELGQTRTDTDGRFAVTYSEADYALEEPFERDPEVYIRLRDRTGRIVHTDDAARPFPPSADDPVVIELDADVLDRHDYDRLVDDPTVADEFERVNDATTK